MTVLAPALLTSLLLSPLTVSVAGGVVVARAELEAITMQNALDGSVRPGCHLSSELESGREYAVWVTFGEVTPDGAGGWQGVGRSCRCGTGSYGRVGANHQRLLGTPYVILEIRATPTFSSLGGSADLTAKVDLRKFLGFEEDGRPAFARSMQDRSLGLRPDGEVWLPVLLADPREREAFRVHDVLLGLKGWVAHSGPAAAYGSIRATSDQPGVEVLLDGAFVGRTQDRGPLVLKNVPIGSREISVRDFSGREARSLVEVRSGSSVEVVLKLLHAPPAGARADLHSMGANPQGHQEYWRVKDGAIVVRIPAGEFLMGSPPGEGEAHERPQHRVHLSEFLIDKIEVTWRQFHRFAADTGAAPPAAPSWGTPDDYPVSSVSWDEAKAYCEWVGGRLPTEAEWEKSARGEDGRRYPWGDAWDPDRCNSWEGGPNRPESAGSFPDCVSPYGVLDMPGSLWEWCADRYGEGYYSESPSADPEGPTSGDRRVLRGGAWISQPLWVRAAYRHNNAPSARLVSHGFRCAQAPPE